MDYEKIGKFIQEQRKKLGLTQQQLADKLKVTNKAISRWETGTGCPDVSLLGELSENLNVGIGELLQGEYNDQLKDNNQFILDAVNYSKQATALNIYRKISNMIYILLGLISVFFIINMMSQFHYLAIDKQEIYVDEKFDIDQRLMSIQNKADKLLNLENSIYSDAELNGVKASIDFLISIATDLKKYKDGNRITVHPEELLYLYYYAHRTYSSSDNLSYLAARHDPSNILIYKLAYTCGYDNFNGIITDELGIHNINLYNKHSQLELKEYVSFMKQVWDKYENNLNLLLEIGGYHE